MGPTTMNGNGMGELTWIEWAKKQGLATILVLLGVGFIAGWIPSPIKSTAEVLAAHAIQMEQLLQESRFQTALLATVCFKLATPAECLNNLMKERSSGFSPTQEDQTTLHQAYQ